MRNLKLTAALLACAAFACNRLPEPQAASHPPAADLTCPAEPEALTEAEAASAAGGVLERAFNDGVLLSGRACRDTVKRVCEWHRERGAEVPHMCRPTAAVRP